MCKSANQPGGPYRCSGDMGKRYDAAIDKYFDASTDEGLASLAAHRAHTEATVQEMRDDADDKAVTVAKKTAADADKALAAARTKRQQARDAVSAARADYDSTPVGIGELQATIAEEPDDPALQERLQNALTRMNDEAEQRDEKWGTSSPVHTAFPVGDDPVYRDALINSEAGPKVVGSLTYSGTRRDETGFGEPLARYEATFSNTAEDGTTTRIKVPVTAHPMDDNVTQSYAVRSMARSAATAGRCSTLREYCDANDYDYDAPNEREVASADFKQAQAMQSRGERIFGAERWSWIMNYTSTEPAR